MHGFLQESSIASRQTALRVLKKKETQVALANGTPRAWARADTFNFMEERWLRVTRWQ